MTGVERLQQVERLAAADLAHDLADLTRRRPRGDEFRRADAIRLLVDHPATAPVDGPSEVVAPDAMMSADFVFDVAPSVQYVILPMPTLAVSSGGVMIDIDLTGMGRNLDKRRFDPSSTIPGLDITIQEMRRALHDLYANVGGPQRRAGALSDPLRPWRGVRYWVFALIVGLLGLYFGWIGRDMDFDGTPGWVIYGGLGAAMAFYLGLRGAVCFRPRAETLIALDGRAPVIYLRSFRDDGAVVGRPMKFNLDVVRWKYLMTEYTRAGFLRVMFHRGKVRLK